MALTVKWVMNTLLISLRLHLQDAQIITAALVLCWLASLRSAALRRGEMRQGQDGLWSKCRNTHDFSSSEIGRFCSLDTEEKKDEARRFMHSRQSCEFVRPKAEGGGGIYQERRQRPTMEPQNRESLRCSCTLCPKHSRHFESCGILAS